MVSDLTKNWTMGPQNYFKKKMQKKMQKKTKQKCLQGPVVSGNKFTSSSRFLRHHFYNSFPYTFFFVFYSRLQNV